MSPSNETSESGVVLVEFLAALSILALMTVMMAGFFDQLRIVSRLGDEVAVRTELSVAADHLARTISAARAVPLSGPNASAETDSSSNRLPVLVGEDAGLRFVAVTPRGFGTLGLSEVTIASRSADGRLALVEILRPAHPGDVGRVTEVVVIEDLDAAHFSYVDADGAVRTAWSEHTLPVGVHITLTRDHPHRPVRVRNFASMN